MQVNERIQEFKLDSRFNVAVSVEMLLTGVDILDLTDLVLLRRFRSQSLFLQAISRVLLPFPNKTIGRIWDFADNQDYHSDDLAEILFDRVAKPADSPQAQTDVDKSANPTEDDPSVLTYKRVIPIGDLISGNDLLGRKRLAHVLNGIIEYTSIAFQKFCHNHGQFKISI